MPPDESGIPMPPFDATSTQNVHFGSLADIGEACQGCPLYPSRADMLIAAIDACYVP